MTQEAWACSEHPLMRGEHQGMLTTRVVCGFCRHCFRALTVHADARRLFFQDFRSHLDKTCGGGENFLVNRKSKIVWCANFDFNLPERFDISFIGEDGKAQRLFMVHRALLGSIERFFGVLIEHYAGAFPIWLCPMQVLIIPITDEQLVYAQQVLQQLRAASIRAGIDSSNKRMGYKIRSAQEQKIPYMLIIGKREVANGEVAVRLRTEEDLGAMQIEALIARIEKVVVEKAGI